MRFILPAIAALALGAPAQAHDPAASDAVMQAAINHASRVEDRARDQFRNPAETLKFFQLEPGMKVGEYGPGGGWYTRILSHYLADRGQYVALWFNLDDVPFPDDAKARIGTTAAEFPAAVANWTGHSADKFKSMTMNNVPESEKGTFDRILLFRTLHGLSNWNMLDSEIKAMHGLLKPGGMIGVVQHRAAEGASDEYSTGPKGYMSQDHVINMMNFYGFDLVGVSEINANPKDKANHPAGVWYLPPTNRDLADGDAVGKASRDAIGESDRMTLLFRKRS